MIAKRNFSTKFFSKVLVNATVYRELFSVAPMVQVSDKYFRFLMRLLSKRVMLYTQMFKNDAIINTAIGPRRLLGYAPW
jgi:tRNA-dihydrouridine synthase